MLMQVVEIHRRKRIVGRVQVRCCINHILIADISRRVAGIVGCTAIEIVNTEL